MTDKYYLKLRELYSASLVRDLILFFFLFILVIAQNWDDMLLILASRSGRGSSPIPYEAANSIGDLLSNLFSNMIIPLILPFFLIPFEYEYYMIPYDSRH